MSLSFKRHLSAPAMKNSLSTWAEEVGQPDMLDQVWSGLETSLDLISNSPLCHTMDLHHPQRYTNSLTLIIA